MTVREMIESLEQLNSDMEIVYKNEGVWMGCAHPEVKNIDGEDKVVIGI